MKVDVACVGAPFLDLIFHGLPALPAAGEERLASRLAMVPGGMANVAYALRQLDLEAVVCAPGGHDAAGRLLAELMAGAGVPWIGRDGGATAVSVAMPVAGDRAFVTFDPRLTIGAALAGIEPRAIVVDLPNVALVAADVPTYAVVGDPEVAALRRDGLPSLHGLRALLLNEREVRALTGLADVRAAARTLALQGTTVVVTLGPSGAIATEPNGDTTRAVSPRVSVPDPTGAGDLFTAGYVWADLAGVDPAARLRTATSFASMSLARAGRDDRQKGVPLEDLRRALASAGPERQAVTP